MSLIVVLYSVVSLVSYLGLTDYKILNMFQSCLSATKISALCIGYRFDALSSQHGQVEYYFTLMTVFITIDAFFGFEELVRK